MTSLKVRLAYLEAKRNEGKSGARPLTDAERAVRLIYTVNGHDMVRRAKVLAFLQAAGIPLQFADTQPVSPTSTGL